MTHCHCSRCRKAHGVAFATYVGAPGAGFRMLRGDAKVGHFVTSPTASRAFCTVCGSVVPSGPTAQGMAFLPAAGLDGDLGVRPVAHLFAGSKAPWYRITDGVQQFEAFPPGVDAPVLPDRAPLDPPGRPRGSCLCGGVAFVLESAPVRAMNCHCSRCHKARAAAHASNLFVAMDGLRFTRGTERIGSFHVPGARFFTQAFCRDCGGKAPRLDPERGIAVVPMGTLDDDPGIAPQGHIYVGSKASWFEITDGLPQHVEAAPPA
jgi:hypothetical protein